MNGTCIVLGVTGGIAAYKSAELVSRLRKEGFDVHVIMTKNAMEFITPLPFETLSNNPVTTDTFRRDKPWEVEHVSLGRRADLLVVAPATANFIGKLANGIADDMLSTTALATEAPVLIAPAMNTRMYQHPAVQENIEKLKARGCHFVGPASGLLLADGETGVGRMSEPAEIVQAIHSVLGIQKTLVGKKLLVTAGPTREPIDPVRYITNRSSGKMGYALAEEALRRGAEVVLVSGPVALTPPTGADLIQVNETAEMYDAVVKLFPECDAAIMAAAPADYRPETVASQKIKKTPGQPGMSLQLVENADIAAALGRMKKPNQRLIVFAAETENMQDHARGKLLKKNADLAVANDVTEPGSGFDVDTNRVTLISTEEADMLPLMSKADVAKAIIGRLEHLFK